MKEKHFNKIEVKSNIYINVFGYGNKLIFPIYVSSHKFENSMDFLLLIDDNKSHYVYMKDFNRFMFHKTKNKNKKYQCHLKFMLILSVIYGVLKAIEVLTQKNIKITLLVVLLIKLFLLMIDLQSQLLFIEVNCCL